MEGNIRIIRSAGDLTCDRQFPCSGMVVIELEI